MMSAFNKKLVSGCLRDSCELGGQGRRGDDGPVVCGGVELRLNRLMDDRVSLSSDVELRAHADDCLECRQVLQRYQQLELLLGGGVCLRDEQVELAAANGLRFGMKRALGWVKAPVTAVALVALVVFAGRCFNGQGDVGAVAVPSVVVVDADLESVEGDELVLSSSAAEIGDLLWAMEGPVSQLKGWVDSGSELLATGEEQVAVIRGLSNVRLDLVGLESRLESLQPVLNYSARIPALSPMQGTVCFTLGWLKRGRAADLQADSVEPAVEVGQWPLRLRELV